MLLAGAGGVTKLSLQNGTYDPCHGIGTGSALGSALLISIVTALPMIPIYGGAARPSTAPSRERRGFSFGVDPLFGTWRGRHNALSGKIPTALGLIGGIASAWPRLATLVIQGRGHSLCIPAIRDLQRHPVNKRGMIIFVP
jgi:hypothetical protein